MLQIIDEDGRVRKDLDPALSPFSSLKTDAAQRIVLIRLRSSRMTILGVKEPISFSSNWT